MGSRAGGDWRAAGGTVVEKSENSTAVSQRVRARIVAAPALLPSCWWATQATQLRVRKIGNILAGPIRAGVGRGGDQGPTGTAAGGRVAVVWAPGHQLRLRHGPPTLLLLLLLAAGFWRGRGSRQLAAGILLHSGAFCTRASWPKRAQSDTGRDEHAMPWHGMAAGQGFQRQGVGDGSMTVSQNSAAGVARSTLVSSTSKPGRAPSNAGRARVEERERESVCAALDRHWRAGHLGCTRRRKLAGFAGLFGSASRQRRTACAFSLLAGATGSHAIMLCSLEHLPASLPSEWRVVDEGRWTLDGGRWTREHGEAGGGQRAAPAIRLPDPARAERPSFWLGLGKTQQKARQRAVTTQQQDAAAQQQMWRDWLCCCTRRFADHGALVGCSETQRSVSGHSMIQGPDGGFFRSTALARRPTASRAAKQATSRKHGSFLPSFAAAGWLVGWLLALLPLPPGQAPWRPGSWRTPWLAAPSQKPASSDASPGPCAPLHTRPLSPSPCPTGRPQHGRLQSVEPGGFSSAHQRGLRGLYRLWARCGLWPVSLMGRLRPACAAHLVIAPRLGPSFPIFTETGAACSQYNAAAQRHDQPAPTLACHCSFCIHHIPPHPSLHIPTPPPATRARSSPFTTPGLALYPPLPSIHPTSHLAT